MAAAAAAAAAAGTMSMLNPYGAGLGNPLAADPQFYSQLQGDLSEYKFHSYL